MSTFEVPIVRINKVEHHPNADRLSLIYFRDYAVISAKLEDGSHRYNIGDLVTYVPEGAIVPEWLLRCGFWDEEKGRGFLSGSNYDRVKAMKLRGIISQGIMFSTVPTKWNFDLTRKGGVSTESSQYGIVLQDGSVHPVKEGDNVADILGVYKYEPRVPTTMSGEYVGIHGYTPHFDVENIKRYPDVFEDGEPVEFTEKCHGTFCGMTVVPGLFHPEIWCNDTLVYSKGLGAKGLIFKDNEANTSNIYLSMMKKLDIREMLITEYPHQQVTVFGEIYGNGVQDLTYGLKDKTYAAFDIFLGDNNEGRFLDRLEFELFSRKYDLPIVPILYQGGFSKHIMNLYTNGKTVAGNGAHIREGIVIRPMKERRDPELGRMILKSVSDAYLLRKNGTEYN